MIMVIIPGGPAIRFESRRHGTSEKKRWLMLGVLLRARGSWVAERRRQET